jgi:signal transduction histidine kinase/DNA-binding response OmpR family regulator/HAMP domain-containing protein
MKIRKISLLARLIGGFFVMLLLTVGVGAWGIYEITSLSDIARKINYHPFTVSNAVRDINDDFKTIRIRFLMLMASHKPEDIEKTTEQITAMDLEIQGKLKLAGERYLGPKEDFRQLQSSYDTWKSSIRQVFSLLRQGKQAAAEQFRQDTVIPQAEKLSRDADTLIEFAASRANRFMEEAQQKHTRAVRFLGLIMALAVLLCTTVAILIIRSITAPVQHLIELSHDLALGRELKELPVPYHDEIGQLERSFNAIIASNNQVVGQARSIASGNYTQEIQLRSGEDTLGISLAGMTSALVDREREHEAENWLKSGQNQLGENMRGNQELHTLATTVTGFLASWLHSQAGCLYLINEKTGRLRLQGSYACQAGNLPAELVPGEGVAGQAAADRRVLVLSDIPDDYLRIGTALGETRPRHLLVVPFLFEERLLGMLELASLEPFSELEQEFVSRIRPMLGACFNIALAGREMQELLQTTLSQAEELQLQQEELNATNEELEEQTRALKTSELLLKEQQEELRASNEELEEKTQDLELQREKILLKNRELETVQAELEQKAHDLEQASQYKSDFLSNMSHELRTPLNSLLILSRDLMENRGGNLTTQQVESAEVILKSGMDLLHLINDILDLARIEAGRMDLVLEKLPLPELSDALKARFIPQYRSKGIELHVLLADDAPESIISDQQRLDQILNNLLSNAFKFTESGRVDVTFAPVVSGNSSVPELVITVRDSGIGIPADKLQGIFESFRQADGSTSRRYGGSGLGLAISRNLAELLGGTITVESAVGVGSTFTLRLPLHQIPHAAPATAATPLFSIKQPPAPFPIPKPAVTDDDRNSLNKGERCILIIEDDCTFAATLRDVCRGMAFKAVCAPSGEEGLDLAREHNPTAVILDLRLPGMNGWQVLEAFKADTGLRHIPVHIISCEPASREAYTLGAVGFLSKPATRDELEQCLKNLETVIDRNVKELLLVEDDDSLRLSIERLIANDDIAITAVPSGSAALAALGEKTFDCMVLDLGLPDMSGFELLKRLRNDERCALLPVIVYTGRELSREEERELRHISESIIVKGARSEERLVDETAIFLHRVVSNLNRSQQQYIINLHDRDFYLHGKVVLLVDDDMRNMFALASVLEQRGLSVIKAEDGAKAISVLQGGETADIILMDIMMPGLDGYQTTRAIRELGIRTPIIALTAKAMKEDRDKCLAAGADDYLAKPVDMERLMSMMRVWLYA